MIGGKSVPEWSFVHPKKQVFVLNILVKPAPNLFSGPNWLYGAFGDKILPDQNFAQFCLKSPLEFVFPKNTFLVWIFALNRTSPIFLAKRTRWHDWGEKCPRVKLRASLKTRFRLEFFDKTGTIPLFLANWLYGTFGGKIVSDGNFAQFCLSSPLEVGFPKNTFSFPIFVLNRTSLIFRAKRTRWHDWGQKCPGVKFRPS